VADGKEREHRYRLFQGHIGYGGAIMIHANSIASYRTINLTKRQAEVVEALKILGKGTDLVIANFMGKEKNCITGRITELIAKGVVVELKDEVVISKYGKPNRVTRLAEFSENLF
jgi:hypothetical protein